MEKENTEKINEELKREILKMVEEDQKMRKGGEFRQEIDVKNTERIKEVINQYGWPGKLLVGEDGSDGVWLLVQHADHDVEFQKRALELLKDAVVKREVRKIHEAYLTDRVLVNSGKPQIFGTQFYKNKKEKYVPRLIEDETHLDDRRKEFGLEPFSGYKQRMQNK